MNIFGSDIANRGNLNRMGNQQNSRISHAAQPENASGTDRASAATTLQTGQVFEGEVIDITPKNVSIRLDNQQVIQARLGESMELNIGQKMLFEVKEQQGEQIVIHPKSDANISGQNMAALKALSANGLTISDRNVQIANALMEAGMPLNHESMRKVMQQSMNYPEVPVKTLISMNQLGIPVNEQNIMQFTAYANHEHQMTTAIGRVIDSLDSALTEVFQNQDVESMKEFLQDMNRIFGFGEITDMVPSGGQQQEIGQVLAGEPQIENANGQEQEKLAALGEMETEMPEAQITQTNANGVSVKSAQITDASTQFLRNMNGDRISDEQAVDAGHKTAIDHTTETGNIELLEVGQNQAENTWETHYQGEASIALLKQDGVDTGLLHSIQNQLTEAGVPSEAARQMLQDSHDYGDLLANITNYLTSVLSEHSNSDRAIAKQIFQSDGFHKLIKKAVQEEWLMKPENMKSPEEIDELYKKVLHQSAELENSLNSGGSGNRNYSEAASNMRDNIHFMQQLNEQFVYAQVPMNMSGTEANSELFVYANKKRLQQNTDGVKVLLHLDMPNLGSTDILIRLKDNKLHASFRMEDSGSVTIVADNMWELTEKLEAKGFVFTNEVVKQEKKTGKNTVGAQPEQVPDAVIDEMLNQDLVTGQRRFTFDIRG